MELHSQLTTSAAVLSRLVRDVTPAQLSDPTPCGDWDVRTLLNHVILWPAYSFERRARREPVPDELVNKDFVAEPDYALAYAEQLDKALAAWSEPAAWEGEIDLGGMAMPATTIASMVLKEMVVHGWDLARATGQEFSCDEDVARTVLGVVEEHAEIYRQYDGFAEPVAVPESAPTLDRALALSGRNPAWTTA